MLELFSALQMYSLTILTELYVLKTELVIKMETLTSILLTHNMQIILSVTVQTLQLSRNR